MVKQNNKIINQSEQYITFPKDPWEHKYFYDMEKICTSCVRCSNCKWIDHWEVKNSRFAKICPANSRFLFDAFSCQGKMDIAYGIVRGNLQDTPKLLDVIYTCDTCGGCDASCKRTRDAEPLKVFLDLRSKMVEEGNLLPQFIPYIDNLRKEDNMMLQPKADRIKWAEGLKVKDLTIDKAEVVFHTGCNLSYNQDLWPVARTAISLLIEAGVDVGIMGKDENCCGSRLYDIGYRGEFTKYAENNIEAWKNAGVKTVVTACSDCYWGIKRLYPELGAKFEVLHIVEYIERLISEGKIKFKKTIPMVVTYHDPCHLGRRSNVYSPGKAIMGVYDAPRNILKKIPGIELVEMFRIKEYAFCCGAGGGVREAYPDFSMWTANERITEAKTTGAEALVTACPWCEINFMDSIKKNGDKIKILDIIELVRQAM
jgi:Fe-S oxidoreductase